MSKKARSFTIDEHIAEELTHRPEINASAVVNDYLREFLNATDKTQEEVILQQLNERIDEKRSEIEKKENKLEELVRRRDNIKDKIDGKDEQSRQDAIEAVAEIPADPSHPLMEETAEEIDITAEELARLAADVHGKEFDPFNDGGRF